MSYPYLEEFKSIQDKTSPKGVYFFFSFIYSIFIFINLNIISLNELFNPLDNLDTYIVLASTASFITAFLYFSKLENFFLKRLLSYKGIINSYFDYRNVSFSNTFEHPVIFSYKNKFISKLLFFISGMGIIFILWDYNTFVLFLTFFTLIFIFYLIYVKIQGYFIRYLIRNIVSCLKKQTEILEKELSNLEESSLKNESIINLRIKRIYYRIVYRFLRLAKIFIKYLITILSIATLIIITFFNFLDTFNLIPTLFLILEIVLYSSLRFNWFELELRHRLIYFMEMFLQDSNLSETEPLVKDFSKNIKQNYWSEAKYNIHKFFNEYFESFIYNNLTQNEAIINYFQRVIELTGQILSQGYPSTIRPTDNNAINTHYLSKSVNHVMNNIMKLDRMDKWMEQIIIEEEITQFREEFNNLISFFNSYLKSFTETNMSIHNFCVKLAKEKGFVAIFTNSIDKVQLFIEFYYYFESLKKKGIKIDEKVKKLKLDLNLKTLDNYQVNRERKKKKNRKYAELSKTEISKKLTDIKLKMDIKKVLSDTFGLRLRKIAYLVDQYSVGTIPDDYFIVKSTEVLGKDFIKKIKKINIRKTQKRDSSK